MNLKVPTLLFNSPIQVPMGGLLMISMMSPFCGPGNKDLSIRHTSKQESQLEEIYESCRRENYKGQNQGSTSDLMNGGLGEGRMEPSSLRWIPRRLEVSQARCLPVLMARWRCPAL